MIAETLEVATTAKRQVVDLTEAVNRRLKGWEAGDGACPLFVRHTTATIRPTRPTT